MLLNDRIFQTEVGKYVTDDNNLIVNSMTMAKPIPFVNANRNGVEAALNDGVFSIKAQGLTGFNFTGFSLPPFMSRKYTAVKLTL